MLTTMGKKYDVTRHKYIEQYLQNYSEYQKMETSIQSQKIDIDIQSRTIKQKEEERDRLLQDKAHSIRDVDALKAREMQAGLDEKEAAEKYIVNSDKNLIDEDQYRKERDAIKYKQKMDSVLSKKALKKELDEKKELLSAELEKLRQEEKGPENLILEDSEILYWDNDISGSKYKKNCFVSFLEKEKKHDKKVASINASLKSVGKAEIISKTQNIRSIEELKNRCDQLVSINPYEEQGYKKSKINTFIIPILCGAVSIVGMLFLLYTMDLSGGTQLAGEGIASIVWKVIIAVALAGMGGVMVASDMVGEWMYKVIPVAMLGILIVNGWGTHIGAMAWANNIFWLIVLLGILKLLSKLDNEEVAIVFLVIFFVLAMFWEFKIQLKTPLFMVNVFAFLANAALRYLIPVLCGGVVFCIIRILFTKTPMGKIVLVGQRKKYIKGELSVYEKDKDGYLILYYVNFIELMIERSEKIQELQDELLSLDEVYEDKIRYEEENISEKYEKCRKQLAKDRDEQIRERDNYILRLKLEKENIGQDRLESEKKKERLEWKIKGLHSEIEKLKKEKGEKLEKLSQQTYMFQTLETLLRKMSNELRKDSEDALEATAGVMDNKLYFDVGTQKDRTGFIKLQVISHNCEKLVLLYDEEKEILHGNLAKGLENYIDWLAAAFTRTNYWGIFDQIKMRIIDVVSGGKPFVGGAKGDSYIVYDNSDAIQRYEREVKKQIEEVTEMCDSYVMNKVDISELNKKMAKSAEENGEIFGEDEPNAKYNVCFIMIPNDKMQNPDIIPQSLWSYFNGCERYGIMPIFFVGDKTWRNLDRTHQMKTQVKEEHIYEISRTENAMDIRPYAV